MTSWLRRRTLLRLVMACLLLGGASQASASLELLESAFRGNSARVQQLLERGANPNYRDSQGSTALMVAASSGHVQVVTALLASGAQVNARNDYGWTPLMLAVAARHEQIAQLLLERGADPEMRNRRGDSARTLAQSARLEGIFAGRAETGSEPAAPPPSQTIAEPQQPSPRAAPRSAEPPTTSQADARQREVDRLFRLAEGHVRALRLTEPAGRNAFETYQRLQALGADSDRIEAGLASIVDRYERLARQRQRAGDLAKARTYVERGLGVVPGEQSLVALQEELERDTERQARRQQAVEQADALLAEARNREAAGRLEEGLQAVEEALELVPGDDSALALRARLSSALEQQGRNARIRELLTTAEQQYRAGALTTPPDANAVDSYQEALRLDPNNAEARAGLSKVVAELRGRAQAALQRGELDQALTDARAALTIAPDDQASRKLEARASEAIAEVEHKEQQLATLATRIRQQLAAGRLVAPPQDNAASTLQRMAELGADDSRLPELRQLVLQALTSRAQQQRAEGELEQSLASVEAGLALQPQDQALRDLATNLEARIAAAAARQAAAAERRRAAEERLAAARELQRDGQLQAALVAAREGLEYDSDAPRLRELISQLQSELTARQQRQDAAAALYAQARELADRDQLDAALSKAEQGLELDADHAALTELQQSLSERVAARERLQRRVAALLERAQAQLDALRLTVPAGDNAYETLQQVQALDPDNAEAQAGLEEIAGRYRELAQTSLRAENLQDAAGYVERGLEVIPEHSGLQALASEIESRQQAIAEAERRAQAVATQLSEARQHMAAGQLEQAAAAVDAGLEIAPEAPELIALRGELEAQLAEQRRLAEERANTRREATELLQQAQRQREGGRLDEARAQARRGIELLQDQPQAEELRQQLAELERSLSAQLAAQEQRRQALQGLLAEARRQQDAGDLDAAQATLERALALAPDSAPAQRLHSELDQQIAQRERRRAEAEQRQAKIAELLSSADRLMSIARLVEDNGNDALSAFRDVLALDPDNQKAQEGLERLRLRLLRLAQSYEHDGDDSQALIYADKGLQVAPESSELVMLRTRAAERLDARRAAEEEAQTLLARARRQQAEGDFQGALQRVTEGLALVPQHEDLAALGVALRSQIEERAQRQQQIKELYAQAQEQFGSGELQVAESTLQEALKLAPAEPRLVALRDLVEQRVAREKARAEERARRLEQARALLERRLELYAEVLATVEREERSLREATQQALSEHWGTNSMP